MQQRCPDQPRHGNDHANADQAKKQRTRHPRLWIAAAKPLRSIGHADNLFGASRARRAGELTSSSRFANPPYELLAPISKAGSLIAPPIVSGATPTLEARNRLGTRR